MTICCTAYSQDTTYVKPRPKVGLILSGGGAKGAAHIYAESNIGKVVTYTLERINGLYVVIKNGLLDVSNNMAERTMRGHAMGRNNYLFCQNEQSAERTCKIYSIIESCKLCRIDPYRYICEILSRKPEVGESWDNLLPSNIKFA